ncbi:MAG: EutN/CcmL family microcompartment protein [Verrucomicrobiae bacterium]|nr:EutN/CcmL family microcompartment protein [Verrucomicrobiae bacterium]
MRLGKVIGRVTLSQQVPSVAGGRWLIISPFTRKCFQNGKTAPKGLSGDPTPVVYDNIGGGLGDTIGFMEGREAAVPFEQPAPVDGYNAAIVDEVFYKPFESQSG